MPRLALWVMIASLTAGASVLAEAKERGRERAERGGPPAERVEERDWRDDSRRRGGESDRQRYRMSDEEREKLRRDIEEAGRDVYRRPGRR